MSRAAATAMIAALAGAAALSVAMAATHRDYGLGLGPAWAWVLTGLQVSALFAAGKGYGVGWLLGASIQVCWMTYAMLTSQHGFIPGCLVSLLVQGYSYLRTLRIPSQPLAEMPQQEFAEKRPGIESGNTGG